MGLPIRDAYVVADGLLAGEYPGASDPRRGGPPDHPLRELRDHDVRRPDAPRRLARALRAAAPRGTAAGASDRGHGYDDDPPHDADPRRHRRGARGRRRVSTSTAGAGSAARGRRSAAGSSAMGSIGAMRSARSKSCGAWCSTRSCPRHKRQLSGRWSHDGSRASSRAPANAVTNSAQSRHTVVTPSLL